MVGSGNHGGIDCHGFVGLDVRLGSGPAVETPRASTPLFELSTSGALPGALVVPWQDLAATAAIPSRGTGEEAKSNLPVLFLSTGVALVLSLGTLWADRQRREGEAVYQSSPRLTTLAGVSVGASI